MVVPHEDNYLFFDENCFCEVTLCSVIGQRDEQQDSAGFSLLSDCSLAVVCDGMGGLDCGGRTSSYVVERMIKAFDECAPFPRPKSFLMNAASALDSEVHMFCDEKGNRIKTGTTFTAALIQNRIVYWFSVGDSRIYFLRDREMKQVTCDHTYAAYLTHALNNGSITESQYRHEIVNGAGLISFIGIGNLKIFDSGNAELMSGDRIIMMTDGIFKYITDEEIRTVLLNHTDITELFKTLGSKIDFYAAQNNVKRDNATIVLVTVK